MTPIEFPQQTIVWAKDQPPYLPLPAFTNERETISRRLDRIRAAFDRADAVMPKIS